MAIGDIAGDLKTTYGQDLTPAQRAARQAAQAGGLSTLNGMAVNVPPSGPIGRAQQQSGPASSLGDPGLGLSGPPGARQTSFDVTNTPAKYLPPEAQPVAQPPQVTPPAQQSVASGSSLNHANLVTTSQQAPSPPGVFSADPLVKNAQIAAWRNQSSLSQLGSQAVGIVNGVRPTPAVPAPSSMSGISLLSSTQAQPAASASVSAPAEAAPVASGAITSDQFRPTGVGAGAQGGQIVARTGPNGETQFSNIGADQQSARGLGQISAIPSTGAQPPGSLASLGSAGNLGDGVGTFSQAQTGDAALSAARFGRANDIRQETQNQSRLDQALGAQWTADHTNVVHDSSKPLTAGQKQSDQSLQQTRDQANNKVSLSQALINSNLQSRSGEQQLKQATSLNDLQVRATAPDATAVDQQNFLRAKDPAGLLKLQQEAPQLAATLANTQAKTNKLIADTGGTGPKLTEGQSKDFNYYERGNAANAELSSNGVALTNAPIGERGQSRAVLDTALRSLPVVGNSGVVNSVVSNERQKAEQSGREFINAVLRKDSGAALTDTEISEYGRTYLPQSGDSDEVLKQKDNARARALQAIKDGLGNVSGIAAPVNRTPASAASAPTAVKRYSFDEAKSLPSGTEFVDSTGTTRIKH